MNKNILNKLSADKKSGKKSFAVLIDPDEYRPGYLPELVEKAHIGKVDYFFVGGSLVMGTEITECVKELKLLTDIPIIIFPGSPNQICESADAIFFLSLVSGRNSDLLIGKHVESAPILNKLDLEVLPTGYILIESGAQTTASYISNSVPIPSNKPKIAQATALAAMFLGMQIIYMDAGSGAKNKIPDQMINEVARVIELPIVVGGGLRTVEDITESCIAGADIVVVGNAIEKDPELMIDMAQAVHSLSKAKLV